MRLRSRFRSIALVLILHLLFLWATPVSAQMPPVGRWTSLEQILTPGQHVAVTRADATHVTGPLVRVSADAIVVQRDGQQVTIPAVEVRQVVRVGLRRSHMRTGAVIGMLTGALALMAIDRLSSHPSSPREAATIGAVVLGLPGGLVGGALMPGEKVVYRTAMIDR